MIDDDCHRCSILTGKLIVAATALQAESIIEQAAIASFDSRARLFGFSQSLNLVVFNPGKPFRLTGMVGSIVGVHYPGVVWDEKLSVRVDLDASLEAMRRDRIVWIDTRYCFEIVKDDNAGGSSLLRSEETVTRDVAWMKAKWGKFVTVDDPEDGYMNLGCRVRRKSKKRIAGCEIDD
jgi:hypothetical protein